MKEADSEMGNQKRIYPNDMQDNFASLKETYFTVYSLHSTSQ